MNVALVFFLLTEHVSEVFAVQLVISRRPNDVVDEDVAMLILIQHRIAYCGGCLAAPKKQIVFRWESGVGMTPLTLYRAGTSLPFCQRNSP